MAPRDELERPCCDFFARFGHADDNRDAPTAVASFERLAHDNRIARAVKGVIRPAIRQADNQCRWD